MADQESARPAYFGALESVLVLVLMLPKLVLLIIKVKNHSRYRAQVNC